MDRLRKLICVGLAREDVLRGILQVVECKLGLEEVVERQWYVRRLYDADAGKCCSGK